MSTPIDPAVRSPAADEAIARISAKHPELDDFWLQVDPARGTAVVYAGNDSTGTAWATIQYRTPTQPHTDAAYAITYAAPRADLK